LTISTAVENRTIYSAITPSSTTLTSITTQLKSDPKVIAVEPDLDAGISEGQAASLTNATLDALSGNAFSRTTTGYFGTSVSVSYVQQPGAALIRLAEAQQQFGTGTGIVAIIDTGVDPTHPAIDASVVPGYDFTRETEFVSEMLDLDPLAAAALNQSTVAFLDNYAAKLNQSTVAFLDQSTVAFLDGRIPPAFGHGTMVAGLVHLVAPSARIMPLKAFRSDGTSKISDIVRAIYYAVDHGAAVINMSFSLDAPSAEVAKALDFAASHHVICIASAGNLGKPIRLYPAGNGNVIGVGSTNMLDVRSSFSNYDVSSARTSAPGEALITIYPGNHYAAVWGTSFSAALFSGAADLMRQASPTASFSAIRDAIDHGARIEQQMGDARLDLLRSLQYLVEN
jgi:subtilisin family serine protease